ncbi:unnamed protein product, partial [Phaeothamnion confervicola]
GGAVGGAGSGGGTTMSWGLAIGAEERDALLNALTPLRDRFLGQSLERLTLPVEQMFPHFDGYMAAVPSKHDLASFLRAAHAELALAAANSDPTLAPLLLRGVAKAVVLLASKAESLVNTDDAAYAFAGGSSRGGGKQRGGGGGGAGGSGGAGGAGAGPGGASTSSSSATGSTAAAAGVSWAATPEQMHNMQLLELLCKLRESLLLLPTV